MVVVLFVKFLILQTWALQNKHKTCFIVGFVFTLVCVDLTLITFGFDFSVHFTDFVWSCNTQLVCRTSFFDLFVRLNLKCILILEFSDSHLFFGSFFFSLICNNITFFVKSCSDHFSDNIKLLKFDEIVAKYFNLLFIYKRF